MMLFHLLYRIRSFIVSYVRSLLAFSIIKYVMALYFSMFALTVM